MHAEYLGTCKLTCFLVPAVSPRPPDEDLAEPRAEDERVLFIAPENFMHLMSLGAVEITTVGSCLERKVQQQVGLLVQPRADEPAAQIENGLLLWGRVSL